MPALPAALFYPRAATLNQNRQNYNYQHTGCNPDNQGAIHIESSFPE
jgi:hypothetical protein